MKHGLRTLETAVFIAGLALATAAGVSAYRRVGAYGDGPFGANFYRNRDPQSGHDTLFHESETSKGRVRQLVDENYQVREIWIDADRDGIFEAKLRVEGAQLVAPIDADQNGAADRWEHYESSGRLIRVGQSSRGDGVEDTWSYPDANGLINKVETDSNRDGVLDKREIFGPTPDGKGRVLVTVESEFDRSGAPHFRVSYRQDGSFEKSEVIR